MEIIDQFQTSMAEHGYDPGEVIPDGKIHRFSINGKPSDKAGWYWFTADGSIQAGVFGDWRTGEKIKWSSKSKSGMTAGELKAYRAAIEEAKRQREAERQREHEAASEKATEDIGKFRNAPADHPYLEKKRVKSFGVKICGNELIIPFKDVSGKIWTYQRIKENGEKLFLTGGKKRGCYFVIQGAGETAYLVEGYATGATVHMATGAPVIVCADAGNLKPVAEALRARRPGARIVIAADDDRWTEGNPGITKARAAADAIGAEVIAPRFSDISKKPTDFNDLSNLEGLDAVKAQLTERKKEKSGFELIDADKLIQSLKPPEFLIDKYFESKTFGQIFGHYGDYKTFVAISMGCSVSTGLPWMGHAVKRGPVVYILGEGHGGFGRRLRAWAMFNEIKSFNGFLMVSRRPARLTVQESAEAVKRSIDEFAEKAGPPALIVIDTLNRNFGPGNENSTEDMTKFVSNIDTYIKNESNILSIHHSGHSERDRGRGNSALPAAIDTEFRCYAIRKMLCRLTCTKMKDAPEPPDINIELKPVIIGEIDGRVIDSLVPVFQSEGTDTKPDDLSGTMGQAYLELENLYRIQRQNLINGGHNPMSARVTADDWKAACLKTQLYKNQNSFNNGKNRLIKKELIQVEGQYVYINRIPDDGCGS